LKKQRAALTFLLSDAKVSAVSIDVSIVSPILLPLLLWKSIGDTPSISLAIPILISY